MVVEVDLQENIQGDGDRYFILVGLPDKAVNESKEGARTAIRNSGLAFRTGESCVIWHQAYSDGGATA